MSSFSGQFILCEDKQSDEINCGDTGVIKIIDAVYGRTNLSVCPHDSIRTNNCRRSVKHDIIKLCDSKPTCEPVATHRNDTCGGTYNYINVTYHCVTTGNYIFTYIIV